jgi:hypothetical protein
MKPNTFTVQLMGRKMQQPTGSEPQGISLHEL